MNKHVFMVINSVYQYSLGVECNHQFVSFTLKNMPRLPGMTVFVTRHFSSHSFFFFFLSMEGATIEMIVGHSQVNTLQRGY
jgi:hypothetical protein